MIRVNNETTRFLVLRIPIVVLVAAFTAIPAELRTTRPSIAELLDTKLDAVDILANVVGYLPVGAVLSTSHVSVTAAVATVLSTFAEGIQLFTKGRSASLLDIVTNVLGAVVGWKITMRWRLVPTRIGITRRYAAGAVALALVDGLIGTRITPRDVEDALDVLAVDLGVGGSVNSRGSESPGTLEAHWEFERSRDGKERSVVDVSGHGANGVLVNGPSLVEGVRGDAVLLNGVNQYADLGATRVLRLTGSLTIAAWINSSAFPPDDAAIVSSLSDQELGYQLDTTIDQGSRTIGFKLGNAWGRLMARYGRTPLDVDRWYHVAGVYDARAKTLDVYVNGRLDDGCQLGTITSTLAVSPTNVYVGRRGQGAGYEFAGSIDDVRIYSRALSEDEIRTELMSTAAPESLPPQATAEGRDLQIEHDGSAPSCRSADAVDARVAGVIVLFGVLTAFATAGLWRTGRYRLVCLVGSAAAGLVFAPLLTVAYDHRIVPVLTLAGGASVALSIRSDFEE